MLAFHPCRQVRPPSVVRRRVAHAPVGETTATCAEAAPKWAPFPRPVNATCVICAPPSVDRNALAWVPCEQTTQSVPSGAASKSAPYSYWHGARLVVKLRPPSTERAIVLRLPAWPTIQTCVPRATSCTRGVSLWTGSGALVQWSVCASERWRRKSIQRLPHVAVIA